jgi:CRP/FNR family cyclic AMP-dependent transcriptional regulator
MGEEGDSMYIIVEGSMKVYQMDDDRKQTVTAILHAGDHVGEMSLIDRKPRSAWLAAREPSTLRVLHHSNFNDMLEKSHSFCLSIMGALTDRLRSANLKIQSLALIDVYGRVAQLLMEMSAEHGGQRLVLEPITHQDVADPVGCTQEMVGKVRRNLISGGFISYNNKKQIIIHGEA